MNVTDAADATVHDYPGGSETLAIRMGLSGAVLRNKVNANNDRNHLTLAEADRMMGLANDFRILQALAASHGFALTKLEDTTHHSLDSITLLALALNSRAGDLSGEIHGALADNVITPNEMAAIDAASHTVQAAIHELTSALRSVHIRQNGLQAA